MTHRDCARNGALFRRAPENRAAYRPTILVEVGISTRLRGT